MGAGARPSPDTGFSTAQRTPSGAYILSYLAGILILIQGIFIAIYGFAWTFQLVGFGLAAIFIGILLVIDGLLINGAAYGMMRMPSAHVAYGTTVLLFSLLALLVGGFILGSFLGIAGGIWAIVWK
jgi:hypothetical protein